MSNDRSALVEALERAAQDGAGEHMASATQLDLLREEDGSLPRDALRVVRRATSGPGRKPGSQNKRTQDLARYIMAKHGDPLDALAEIAFMPPDVLFETMLLAQGGRQIKNKPLTGKDAMAVKMGALEDVLPYVHGKQPLQVDVKGRPDAVIFIPGLNAPNAPGEVLQDAVEKLGVDSIRDKHIELIDGRVIGEEDLQGDAEPEDD